MTNTYTKYAPNVYIAKCDQQYKKGDAITMTTKYGQEHNAIVFNLVKQDATNYYYSVVREDGFNVQEYAKHKASKLTGYAENAEKRSMEWFEKSQEGRKFLALAEPIKIGHHSEKRHRALIERNHNRMGNSVKENEKAKSYDNRIKYWESRADIINLSMPESLEYFEHKLEVAKKHHSDLKTGIIKKDHSYSLPYAKKECNEMEKRYKQAIILWGNNDE